MSKLASLYMAWFNRDAAWWQFWLPGSGLIGGTIAGLLIFGALRALTERIVA